MINTIKYEVHILCDVLIIGFSRSCHILGGAEKSIAGVRKIKADSRRLAGRQSRRDGGMEGQGDATQLEG